MSSPVASPGGDRVVLAPMTGRAVAVIVIGLVLLTSGVVTVLWWAGTRGLDGSALVTARFDALKIGLSVGVGSGGVLALYLAWRKQWATEATVAQKDRDHADVERAYELQKDIAERTDRDATERRLGELFVKAVDQLGSDQTMVRHGGLYTLERVAQDSPGQRQTVVHVLCAYLRLSHPVPGKTTTPRTQITPESNEHQDPADDDSDRSMSHDPKQTTRDAPPDPQDWEMRREVQRIFTAHLRHAPDSDAPQESPPFWLDLDVDLTGATLVDVDLRGCRIHTASFAGVTFAGTTRFDRATFTGPVTFTDAEFTGDADFTGATFNGPATFDQATFHQTSVFDSVIFTKEALFDKAKMAGAVFTDAKFCNTTGFRATNFFGDVHFERTKFIKYVRFHGADIDFSVSFTDAEFIQDADFTEFKVHHDAYFDDAKFHGEAYFTGVRFDEAATFRRARFCEMARFVKTRFSGHADFTEARFTSSIYLALAHFHATTTFRLASLNGAPDVGRAVFDHGMPPELAAYLDP